MTAIDELTNLEDLSCVRMCILFVETYGDKAARKLTEKAAREYLNTSAALAAQRREALTVESVRDYLTSLPHDQDRLDFITGLEVCKYCGGMYLPCYCMRDD